MKLLLLDIETYPTLGWVWGVREQTVAPNQIERPGGLLCWAAKWYGKRGVEFMSLKTDGRKAMVGRMHELLTEADAVIHYNGQSFDCPLLNQEFLLAKMPPPQPYKQIDLYLTARKFRFPYSKMEYVLRATELGGKLPHEGFPMWRKCMGGPPFPSMLHVPKAEYEKAWRTMERYNKKDTTEMEPLYKLMLPWIPNHPNHALYNNENGLKCPKCNSQNLQARGFQRSLVARYKRYQCADCGGWAKERLADKDVCRPTVTNA